MPDLHDLAAQLFQLAPWNEVGETQLIAVDDPASGRRDHISLMGMAGNYRSLALYLGSEARQRFNLIHDHSDSTGLLDEDMLALVLNTRQLQCSFSVRSELYPTELAAIKKAGRKYRGENWPSFRTFHPGHCPRPVDEAEAALLANAIQQVLDLAPVLASGKPTIRPVKGVKGRFEILTRQFRDGAWHSVWTPDDATSFTPPQPSPDPALVEKILRHPQAIPVNVLCQLLPTPIGRTRETSVYPVVLLIVEPGSGFVLGMEMLSTERQTYGQLIASLPDTFLRLCDKHSIRPASIAVTSPLTRALLNATAQALNIPIQKKSRLPVLDAAMDSMMGFLGGGF
jgi:hypothetical protein